MSDIGQPNENILLVSVALAGELLGYPFEAAARLRFLRSAVEQHPPVELAPVTLSLPDDEERAYVGKRFTESYKSVVQFLLLYTVLASMQRFPPTRGAVTSPSRHTSPGRGSVGAPSSSRQR